MQQPRNTDDYIDLIDQAIFEIGDLIACADDEGDGELEFANMLPVLREIEAGLRAMHAEIMANRYTIGRGEDLPFMPVVLRVRERLPIASLIETINLAHKKGFAV